MTRISNSAWTMPPPSSSPPQPPASASTLDNVQNKISPSIALVVAILAIVFFVCGLLHMLARRLLRLRHRRRAREDADSVTAFQGQLQQLFHLHDAGVDQASIDALPVFLYRDVVGGGAGRDPFDCAVCLCEFAPGDRLRLLPKCSHAFHLECIDTWLLSHSTCPLCRRSLLSELSPTCSPVVMVLESESSRDMAATATTRDRDDAGSEPGDIIGGAPGHEEAEEVVEVKLGKFMCVEGNGNASAEDEAGTSSNGNASAEDEAGTSSSGNGDANANAGLGPRRCHSMGSYEYVMDDRASLRVAIKPSKKNPTVFNSGRRGAMSECEFGASKRGGSLRLSFPATAEYQQEQQPDTASAKLAKDSFSESKTWMVPSKRKDPDAAGERRALSFRWPVTRRDDGSDRKAADFDVEAGGSCGDSACSLVEERPSFARRTLLWVVGGGRRDNRVGSCS